MAVLLRQIARTACDLLGYESSAVLLTDDGGGALRIEGSWGLSEDYVRLVNEESPLLLAPEDTSVGSPSRRAFVEDTPVIIDDIARAPSYGPWAKAAQSHGHRSMASVPLRNHGDVVGTMNVCGSDPRKLGPGGLELLQVLASHAGIALETGEQLERDRRRVEELSSLNDTLRHQTWLLRQHAAIHDRFIGVARRGGGVGDIAAALAEITERAVVVQDVSGRTLATVPHAGVSVRPPDWPSWPRQQDGGGPPSLLDVIAGASPAVSSAWFPGLLAGPVRVGQETLRVLWLAGEREDDGLRLRAVEQAAVVLGLEMLRRRAVVDAQWRIRGDLVSELMSGTLSDPAAVIARADRLGSDLRLPQSVLAVRHARADDTATAQLLRLAQSLAQSWPGPKPLSALRDGAIVVIAPASDPHAVDAFARQIQEVGCAAPAPACRRGASAGPVEAYSPAAISRRSGQRSRSMRSPSRSAELTGSSSHRTSHSSWNLRVQGLFAGERPVDVGEDLRPSPSAFRTAVSRCGSRSGAREVLSFTRGMPWAAHPASCPASRSSG